jgi:hypothetical protein
LSPYRVCQESVKQQSFFGIACSKLARRIASSRSAARVCVATVRAEPRCAIESERITVRTSITSRLASLAGAIVLAAAPATAVALQIAPAAAAPTASTVALVDSARTTESAGLVSPSVAWSGVFRVQMALGTKSAAPAALIIERAMEGLSGFMLVDTHSVSLSGVRIEGNVLRARVPTASGDGDLTLRIIGDSVSGTLKVGKQTWEVSGQRSA